MASSNNKINYNLRSSKSIERKMILDVLKEVCTPKISSSYQYIGMGSAFFVDFKMFHKSLGINDMYSFEGKTSNVERCNFNKPFNCIKVIPERTTKGLSNIDWLKKSIVWLDYEDELKMWMLEDIDTICLNAKSGNVLIITLRRSLDGMNSKSFNETFSENIETDVTLDDMHKLNSPKLLQNIFLSRINNKLTNVFSAVDNDNKVKFYKVFSFVYEDGAPMYTFGGIFLNDEDHSNFLNCKFHDLEFIKDEAQEYNITCPIITNKEFHLLNSKIPTESLDDFNNDEDLSIIPEPHRKNFYRTYKYYPNYFEIND